MPSSKESSVTIISIITIINMGKTMYFSSFSQNSVTYCSWSSFSFLFTLHFSPLQKRQP